GVAGLCGPWLGLGLRVVVTERETEQHHADDENHHDGGGHPDEPAGAPRFLRSGVPRCPGRAVAGGWNVAGRAVDPGLPLRRLTVRPSLGVGPRPGVRPHLAVRVLLGIEVLLAVLLVVRILRAVPG